MRLRPILIGSDDEMRDSKRRLAFFSTPPLIVEDPWLWSKLHSGEIITEYDPRKRTRIPDDNHRRIHQFIKDNIEPHVVVKIDKDDGSKFTKDIHGYKYYPKEDRMFVESPSMEAITDMYVILRKKFGEAVRYFPSCNLIQLVFELKPKRQ